MKTHIYSGWVTKEDAKEEIEIEKKNSFRGGNGVIRYEWLTRFCNFWYFEILYGNRVKYIYCLGYAHNKVVYAWQNCFCHSCQRGRLLISFSFWQGSEFFFKSLSSRNLVQAKCIVYVKHKALKNACQVIWQLVPNTSIWWALVCAK